MFIKKEPRVNSPYAEKPARPAEMTAVEENQTNYFEHAAFSEMGSRLFSRPDIIPGNVSLVSPSQDFYQPGVYELALTHKKRRDEILRAIF